MAQRKLADDGPHADLTYHIIGAAIEVHTQLGPGLLESAYQVCLAHEFGLRGIRFEREHAFSVNYKGQKVETGFRADFVVEDKVIVELKSVEQLLPIHEAQLLTYLRTSGLRTGLLINFNIKKLTDGIRRFAI